MSSPAPDLRVARGYPRVAQSFALAQMVVESAWVVKQHSGASFAVVVLCLADGRRLAHSTLGEETIIGGAFGQVLGLDETCVLTEGGVLAWESLGGGWHALDDVTWLGELCLNVDHSVWRQIS